MSGLIIVILIGGGATIAVLFGSFCLGIWDLLYEAYCVPDNPPNIDAD
jgi:hypothetical protein